MAWPGWEEYVPPSGARSASTTRETPMISSMRTENISDSARAPQASKRSKYGAQPTTVDGIRFDSKKEATRYGELKLLEAAGEIWDLALQPKFPLLVPSTSGQLMRAAEAIAQGGSFRLGEYRGDFLYWDKSGKVVEDVKGFKTPLYRWKKKHVEAQYGIEIREI